MAEEETFENETRRLPDDVVYTNQASVTGSGDWDSTDTLVNGLMVYDGKLIYPDGNFKNKGEVGSDDYFYAPANNPNYTSTTGSKYYYRIFQNDQVGSKTGFVLRLQGDGSTLIAPEGTLSTTNIKVSVKLPETGDSQSTGYLNVAKAFETGQYDDDDGSLNGSLSSQITSGNTTTNNVTLGQKFVLNNEYIILRIEADENWTGYLSNIEVDWS